MYIVSLKMSQVYSLTAQTNNSQSFKSFVTSRGTARGRRPLRRAPSRIITDYRLSEKRSISADEIYLMICAVGDHSDMSEKRVL